MYDSDTAHYTIMVRGRRYEHLVYINKQFIQKKQQII